MSDIRTTQRSHASSLRATATIGRTATLTIAVATGVVFGPLVLAGLLLLALVSLGAAMSGGEHG